MSIQSTIAIFIHLIVKIGFSALYLSSIRSFNDLAKEKKWLDFEDTANLWQKASNLFVFRKSEVLDTGLHHLFEKFSDGVITEDQLKQSCTKGYGFTYKNLFFEDKVLFKNLNTFCRLKVREVFEENNLVKKDSTENELLKKAQTLLNSHNDKEHGKKGENVTNWNDWNLYVEWCDKWYETVYGGENSRSWKLAYRYCHKTNLLNTN